MDHLQRTRRLIRLALTLGLMVATVAAYPAAAQAAGTLKKPPTAHIGAAWGSNLNGHLGNGSGVSSSTYVTVSGPRNIAQISDGNSHSLAVTTDGSVYAWGYNGYGELGTGDQSNYPSPQLVAGLSGITQVAAGWTHSLALSSDGTVWAWGDNSFGELGNGTTTQSLIPVQVPGLTGVTQLAAGNGWSLALRSDGTVWGWGGNQWNQLGSGPAVNTTPVQIPGLSRVTSIAAGAFFGMAVQNRNLYTVLNQVLTWGQDTDATMGNGTACWCGVPTPQVVPGLNVGDVEGIAAGSEHAMALGTDGSVWGWGDGTYGDLGDNSTYTESRPVMAIGPGSGITQLAAGAGAHRGPALQRHRRSLGRQPGRRARRRLHLAGEPHAGNGYRTVRRHAGSGRRVHQPGGSDGLPAHSAVRCSSGAARWRQVTPPPGRCRCGPRLI